MPKRRTLSSEHSDNRERTEIQYYLHSLTGGSAEPRRRLLECMIKSGKYGLEDMGFLIHALGDAFAHSYFPSIKWHGKLVTQPETLYTPIIGHLFQMHAPDHISTDPQKYLDYVSALAQSLPKGNAYAEYSPDRELLAKLNQAILSLNEDGKESKIISSDEYSAVIGLTNYKPSLIHYNPDPSLGREWDLPNFVDKTSVIAEWHVLLQKIKQTIKSGECCGK